MGRSSSRLIAIAAIFLATAAAQVSSPLIGTWHGITEPKFPQTVLIFSPYGYYSQIAIPPGRAKPKNDFDHRTREELMKQFGGVRAFYGAWKILGNKLVRTIIASEDPALEGRETTIDFRIDGDTLVLTGQNGHESRFRRMK